MDFVIYVDMLSGAKICTQKKVVQARTMAASHDAYDTMNSDIHIKSMADGQMFTVCHDR